MSIVHLLVALMRFQIPGQDVRVRLFERVQTTDGQYDIFDVGLEQSDGSIDSVVVGGSFSLVKSLAASADEKKAKKEAKKARKAAKKQAAVAVSDVPTEEAEPVPA
jgi:hypothetical protein